MPAQTPQEAFWQGEFGDEYTDRNRGERWIAANTAFFARVLRRTRGVGTVLECGANIGLNLAALRTLLPGAALSAVEINEKAVAELRRSLPAVEVFHSSLFDFAVDRTWDLVFTKNVLIHMNPDRLPAVYQLLYRSCARYILLAEYYNPRPVEVEYRGHAGKLFKRDWPGELMDAQRDLVLVDYGFVYHRDANFRQDDVTWFLLEKAGYKAR